MRVKSLVGEVAVVEWNDNIDTDRYWWYASDFSICLDSYADHENIEGIGNIYENREL